MPESRLWWKIFVCGLLLVPVLCGLASAAQMDLTEGGGRRGPVAVMERDGMTFVALEEVITKLALIPSPINGGFIVTFSDRRIEFWNGTNVARVNGVVSPLAAAVNFDGTHWWGEASSSLQAIKLFLSSASRPSDIKLSPAAASQGNITVNPALPVATPPPVSTVPPATVVTPPPTASPGEVIISRVRWGEQIDAYRAVVDISAQVEAVMTESPGRAEVTFRGAGTVFVSGKSPWSSISVEAKKSNDGATLVFSHSSDKIRGFWVADPPRYVVDFYFSGSGPFPAPTVYTANENINVGPVPTGVPNPGRIETTPQHGGAPAARNRFLVVIDAGHGGHDPGAVGNNLREKDLNLLAALQLGISLKAIGIDTMLTRQDDRFLKLAERSEIANSADADLFISLHCNALPKGRRATGFEIYLMAEPTDQDALNLAIAENREISGDAENIQEINAAADKKTRLLLQILGDMQQNDKINESTTLAEFTYDEIRRAGIEIRKVRQAPFYVLRGAGMPSLLLEMGYISEASDAKKLNSQTERKKMMDAVAVSIKNYLTKR